MATRKNQSSQPGESAQFDKKTEAGFAKKSSPAAGSRKAATKPFSFKLFFIGLAALTLGVLIFALAPGNEPLTFAGFALVLGGLLIPSGTILRRLLRKVYFWLPAVLISFVIIFPLTLSAYVVFFFPNETVRQILQTEMSKALQRPVSIAKLRISLLEGITLENLVVSDKDGHSPFVSASLILSYKLLPLLTGNLVVNKAVLESPSIMVTRKMIAGKAVLNIDDLLAGGSAETAEHVETNVAPTGQDAGIPFAISVGEIGLRNGAIVIEDQATKGFTNRYTLDKLDCLASDVSWPMTRPLAVRFAFRIAMEELGTPAETAKAFSVHPGIQGRLLLKRSQGAMVPEGKIDFFAHNGMFHGQQFLIKAQAFLDTLKADFFRGIQREAEQRIDQFESDLKNMVAKFSGEATKRIESLVLDAQKKFGSVTNELARAEKEASRAFDSSVTSTINSIDTEIRKLERDVGNIFNSVTRIYPMARTKLRLSTYTAQVRSKAEKVKEEYAAFGKKLSEELVQDTAKIIESEKKRFDTWSNTLKNSLDTQIDKYATSVRNEFRRQLANVRSFVDGFELDIPFLRKKMEFDEARTALIITNGVMAFQGLSIGGKEFNVKMDGSYGLVDGALRATLNLSLDTKHASNPLLGLFVVADGRPELGFRVASTKDGFRFSLAGPSVSERMKSLAASKAQAFIKDYLEKNVSLDSFISRIDGGKPLDAGNGKAAITAAKNSKSTALQNEKTRRVKALSDEGRNIRKKIEADAKKAVTKVVPGNLKKPF